MSATPTPRTDEAVYQIIGPGTVALDAEGWEKRFGLLAAHARALERRLAEVTEQRDLALNEAESLTVQLAAAEAIPPTVVHCIRCESCTPAMVDRVTIPATIGPANHERDRPPPPLEYEERCAAAEQECRDQWGASEIYTRAIDELRAKLADAERRADENLRLLHKCADEIAAAEALNRDHEEVNQDKKRLAREIGIALLGPDAPAQPSLCDLVKYAERVRGELAALKANNRYQRGYSDGEQSMRVKFIHTLQRELAALLKTKGGTK